MAAKKKMRNPRAQGKEPATEMWIAENTSRILKGPSGLRGSQWVNPVDYYVRLADHALSMDTQSEAVSVADATEKVV